MDHPQERLSTSTGPTSTGGSPSGQTLRRLAEQLGVSTRYEGFDGQEAQVPDATLSSVLTALDLDVSSERAALDSLQEHLDAPWRRLLPPVVIAVEGRDESFPVHVPSGSEPTVELFAGERTRPLEAVPGSLSTREIDGCPVDRILYRIPSDLAPEWYELRASAPEIDHGVPTEVELAVTPARLSTTDRLQDKRRWGWAVQLYSVASNRTWGVGDLNDLAGLAAIGGEQGADYILINPLHASEPVPPLEASPYLPVTRRFFNPLYLRIAGIPEIVYLRPGDAEVVQTLDAIQRRRILEVDDVERDSVYAAKLKALELLYTVRRSAQRQQQLRRFAAEGGQQLQDFALWCAIREEIGKDSPLWEDEAAGPDSPYAVEARTRLQSRVHFHIWLQWLLDEQLASAQHAADSAGMAIGVMHDPATTAWRPWPRWARTTSRRPLATSRASRWTCAMSSDCSSGPSSRSEPRLSRRCSAGSTPSGPRACCPRRRASSRPSRHCTPTWDWRRRCCTVSSSSTPWASAACRTSPARPTSSTPTGASRWPTTRADACCSRRSRARSACARCPQS